MVSIASPIIISDVEIYSPVEDARTTICPLTEITEADDDYCVVRYTLQPGGIVPLHAHTERRIFYVLSGEADVFLQDTWQALGKNGILDVSNFVPLAWRNRSHSRVTMLLVATMKVARFLRDSALLVDNDGRLEDFLRLSRSYGCWIATQEENTSIGLHLVPRR